MIQLDAVLMNDYHGGYIATCPTMPDCHGRGPTQAAALDSLKQSIVETLADTMSVTVDSVTLRSRQEFPCAADWPLAA